MLAEKQNLTINVEHHLPHGGSDGLMEAEPDLSSSSQRMVISLRSGEERAAHWRVSAEKRRDKVGKTVVNFSCLWVSMSMTFVTVI